MHENNINEEVVLDAIMDLLFGDIDVTDTALESCSVRSFRQAGLMTRDKGLVIRCTDGSEFQVTITRSN